MLSSLSRLLPRIKQQKRLGRRGHLRRFLIESLETRLLLTSDWQNSTMPLDVDDSGEVSPLDVLLLINELNSNTVTTDGVPYERPVDSSLPWYDVSGDGYISPLDVLAVINKLNEPISTLDDTSNNDLDPENLNGAKIESADGSTQLLSNTPFPTPPVSKEIRVNSYTQNNQLDPSIAQDASGRYVVSWTSQHQDGSENGVYFRRYSSTGTPTSNETLAIIQTNRRQESSSIDVSSDGRFVIAWQSDRQDGSNWGVYARHFAADGTPLTGEFLVNKTTSGEQKSASVTYLASGNFVVAWDGNGPSDSSGVFFRIFNAQGVAVGNEVRVNSTTNGVQQRPSIDASSQGFTVAWFGNGVGDADGVFARNFNNSGSPTTDEYRLNSTTPKVQDAVDITLQPDGKLFAAWQTTDSNGLGVNARYFNSTGAPLTNEWLVNQTTNGNQYAPDTYIVGSVLMVSWDGKGSKATNDANDIFVRRFDTSGKPLTAEQLVNCTTGDQQNPVLVANSTRSVIAWDGKGTGDGRGIFSRHLPAAGDDYLQTPGFTGQMVRTTITWVSRNADYYNELGIYPIDDATGRIGNLYPGDAGYYLAALNSPGRIIAFTSGQTAGAVKIVDLPANKFYGVYLVQNATTSRCIAYNPRGEINKKPLAFFGHTSANPDSFDHVFRTSIGDFAWEDQTFCGDQDFDDAIIRFQFGNLPPVLSPIPNQTVAELTRLSVSAAAADWENNVITYSLVNSVPPGVSIDSRSGQITWVPTEAQGPGRYEIFVRATDSANAFDTKSFFVTVLETNLAPTLQTLADVQAKQGDLITFTALATDPDIPANKLRFSLTGNIPTGASIDPVSGVFRWATSASIDRGIYPITVQVSDDGVPSLSDTKSLTITVGNCIFDSALTGWTVFESGGTSLGRGSVTSNACSAVIREGNSFVVGLEQSFVVPSAPSAIRFKYENLAFDTADPSFINDAFEVALVDEDGNTLVAPISIGRDSFFNITEGLSVQTGSGIVVEGQTVTAGLNGIPVGTKAKIIFRLANNDSDLTTTVRITDFGVIDSNLSAETLGGVSSVFASSTVPGQNTNQRVVDSYALVKYASSSQQFVEAVTSGTSSNFLPVLKWTWTSSAIIPNSLNVMMTPAVIDLDQDGVSEIVFGTTDVTSGTSPVAGVLRALNGRDGRELFTVTDAAWTISASSNLAVGDLEGDGSIEIVALDSTATRVLIYESDGRPRLRSAPIEQAGLGAVALADLDRDGVSEIVVGRQVINSDGSIRWTGTGGRGGVAAQYQISVVADIDGDGASEIIAGNTSYTSSGAIKWQAPLPDGYNAIGNFDDDVTPEIVLVSGGRIWLLDHNGQTVWGPTLLPGGGNGGPPTIADYDNDGLPEIGIAGATSYIVLEHDGSMKWRATTQDGSSHVTGSSVFDFDSDGNAEVIYRDETTFRVYDGRDGSVRFTTPLSSCTWSESIIVADVDADQQADIVAQANNNCGFGSQRGIFVFESGADPWSSTRPIWNQHTYHITNINDDGSIPSVEANSWEVYNNYRRNLQPTGTQIGPPTISISAPATTFGAGQQVLISGQATADGKRPDGRSNLVEIVTINGKAVDVLDPNGNIYTLVTILPGLNEIEFIVTDSVGQTAKAKLSLFGRTTRSDIDFSRFSDISGSFSGVYGRTSFNEEVKLLHVDLATRNDGQFETDTPLLVGVKNLSDPTVAVVGFDGYLPDGTPYYDYTQQIPSGRLLPSQSSESLTILFSNPNRNQFRYDLVFLGQLNRPPEITSIPIIEALTGMQYVYPVTAIDLDNDTLSYRLKEAPLGMSIAENNGKITWTPNATQAGNHIVVVQVDDGRGGSAIQTYTVSLIVPPPNRPPVITSQPVTRVHATQFRDITPIPYESEWKYKIVDHSQIPGFESVEFDDSSFRTGQGGFSSEKGCSPITTAQKTFWPTSTDILLRREIELSSSDHGLVVSAAIDNDIQVFVNGIEITQGMQAFEGCAYRNQFSVTAPESALRVGKNIVAIRARDRGGVSYVDASISVSTPDKIVGANSSGIEYRYKYDVDALDPDNDILNYSILLGPTNMTIDGATGLISWTPTIAQIGDHPVKIQASDGRGGVATQEYTICVEPDPDNHAPVIVSQPVTQALLVLEELQSSRFSSDSEQWTSTTLPYEAAGAPIQVLGTYDPTFVSNGVNLGGKIAIDDPDGATPNGNVQYWTAPQKFLGDKSSAYGGSLSFELTNTSTYGTFDQEDVLLVGGGLVLAYDFVGVPDRDPSTYKVGLSEANWKLNSLEGPAVTQSQMKQVLASLDALFIRAEYYFGPDLQTLDNVQLDVPIGSYAYDVEAIDPDGDTLTYSLVDPPSGMTISAATGIIQWLNPSASQPVPVEVFVNDGRGGFDGQSFFITITSGSGKIQGKTTVDRGGGLANWTIYLDQNQNARLDTGEVSTKTDANGNYVFTGLPNGTYFIREVQQPGWIQSFPGNQPFHIVELQSGEIENEVNFGNVPIESEFNQNPNLVSPVSISVNAGNLVSAIILASDPENDPITYSLVSAPLGMTIHPELGTLVWQPTLDQIGDHQVAVQVFDGRGGIDIEQFVLTVQKPNSSPLFTSSIPTQAVQGQPIVIEVHTQDADGDPVTINLGGGSVGTLTETPSTLPNGQPGPKQYRFEWTPNASDVSAGKRTISFEASDGRGGSTTQAVDVFVFATLPNRSPSILSKPRTVAYPNIPYAYQVDAQDSDGNPLQYSLVKKSSGMTISPQGLIQWSTSTISLAPQDVEVNVSDGQGASATQKFQIRVASQLDNTKPTIISNPKLAGREDRLYSYDAVADDAQGDEVVWSIVRGPIGMSIGANDGRVRWTPRNDQMGSNTVTIRATDSLGAFSDQSFAIDVACVNTPPLIVSNPITQAYVSDLYLYGVRATDPDGDKVMFKTLSAPNGMTISEIGLIRWTPSAIDEGQTRRVVVEVSDVDGDKVLQTFDIVVQGATNRNRAPVITSFPVFAVTTGALYSYTVTATDPDNDLITFRLVTQPNGMSIDENTGLLTWTPTAAGIADIVVEARDTQGAIATQGFALSIRDNRSPVINSSPTRVVVAGSTYRYAINATDPDGDVLTYVFVNGPDGSSMDSQGRILWNVPSDFASNAPVDVPISLKVRDSRGAEASQNYVLTVSADTEVPKVLLQLRSGNSISTNNLNVDVGSSVIVRVVATDNVGIQSLALEAGGVSVPLNVRGEATIPTNALGTISLRGRATDAAGNLGETLGSITIVRSGAGQQPPTNDPTLPPNPGPAPGDTTAPTVAITSPAIGSSITNITPIVGTIDDPENHLWYWRAYYARLDLVDVNSINLSDPDLVQFGQGTNEVVNAEIAKFDPTKLENDAFVILVAAFDVNGSGYVAATIVNVEGNVKLGQFTLDFTDLSIPLAGIPMQVSRVYDTRQANREGDFGYGWTLGVQDARILEVAAIGASGAFGNGEGTFVPDKTKVYLTNPSGQRVGFTYKEAYSSGAAFLIGCSFGCFYTPSFVPDPGVYDTLTIDETSVTRGGILGALGGEGINPSKYTLTTKDGTKYRYDQFTGLETITDRNGQTVTFTDSGIKHSSGTEIQFVRDYRGRIKEVVDPDGKKIVYEYDVAGDLRKVTNQSSIKSTYQYLTRPAHFLDEGFDDLGKRDFKVIYDAEGRFKEIVDALGNSIGKQNYDELASRRATVLDANGNATNLLYDARGNVIEETDAAGNKTVREYADSRNPDLETKIIDRRGMVTERAYDARGNVTVIRELGSQTNPLAVPVVSEFAYNANNDVTSIKNAAGVTSIFSYDDKSNVIKITNGLGAFSTFTYDDQGRRKSFTDFNGNTTTFEYDGSCPCGSPHKTIYGDGTYQTFEYNQFGQVTKDQTFEANGTLVEQKLTFYDASGRVIREVVGAGNDPLQPPTDVRKFYNGSLLDWEIIVSPLSLNPDGTLRESPTTPVAQRKSRITDYQYDNVDRLIRQIDAMGGIVNFRYDAQGNRILLQDPVGNITTWTYDSLNRVAEERDPLYWASFVATNSALSSDALLNAVVVENKKPSGASLANNQGAAHVRSFGYDSEGNQSEIIDRNNRRREFSYDYAGRLLTEDWFAANNGPLVETITYAFDVLGNLSTDQNASSKYTYEYDQLNRVKSVDNLDTNPDTPRVILYYEYDAQGNLIKTSDDAGVTVQSTYSKRNQLETRKWFDAIIPSGGTKDVAHARVDFTYTAAGRQKQILRYSDLNKTTKVGSTEFTYDLSGRTDRLIHKNAVDALLSSYDYNYDFSGWLVNEIRDHQNNAYDDNITYGYDLTGQLIDALFASQDDEHYEYDQNGNRRLSVNGNESRNYTNGVGNQLSSDGIYTYTYDGEGNQKTKTRISDGQVTENFWDHHNRLVKVEERSAGGIILKTVEYRYDAVGRRITEIVSGTITLRAVHDGDYTWGDYNANGSADTHYLFTNNIDHIVAAHRDTEGTVWYNTDKVGTIRDISDGSGLAVPPIVYSTFGETGVTGFAWNRYAFTAREKTATTNQYYLRKRNFSADIGRFISTDPLGFAASDANLFRYGFNSPLQFTDPSGTISMVQYAAIGAGILGGVGNVKGYISCAIVRGQEIEVTRLASKFVFGFAIGFTVSRYFSAVAISNLAIANFYYRPLTEGTFCAIVPEEYDPRHYFGDLLSGLI